MKFTLPFINAFPINDTIVSHYPHSIMCRVALCKYSFYDIINSITYSYFYSDTLLPTPSNFLFPLSKQIASDIIQFLIQASKNKSSNNLQLVVLENMLNKHYKQSFISDIDLLLLAFPNRKYTTFETIISSCIAHFGDS